MPGITGLRVHQLDAKGRLAFPSKFRAAVPDGGWLAAGAEQCLTFYPSEAWLDIERRLEAMDPLDPDVRDTKRRMFGMAEQVGFDGQGRINIPVDLLEFAGLTKEVVVIGTGDVIEIWDADAWRAKRDHIDVHAVEIMRRAGGGSST